ncbi:complement factor B-like [Ptychodera flava]|uniref:complement factor B-like n=1 Tax=Ptychodera flava TaxID=63121 RepID=UPI00396A5EE8
MFVGIRIYILLVFVSHVESNVNECDENPGICGNGQCSNLIDSYTCLCDSGYDRTESPHVTCQDIDECTTGISSDEDNAEDTSFEYSYSDVDLSPCHYLATCINTPGSFRCECPTGYEGDGISSCTRIVYSCSDLPAPEHGSVQRISPLRTRFTCDTGYTLYGSQMRLCQNGNWTGRQPFCRIRVVGCGHPGAIEDGQVLGSEYDIGNEVTFVCNGDHRLIGPDKRQCLPNGYWSGYQPYCDPPRDLDDIASDIRQNFIDRLELFSTSSRGHKSLGRLAVGQSLGLDLIFAFDRSSSIDPEDFRRGMAFAKHIIDEFGVSYEEGGTRVAAVSFASQANLEFNLGDESVNTSRKAKRKLTIIQAPDGGTAMKEAFELVVRDILPKVREGSKKAMFIITDGKSNSGSPVAFARRLRHENDFEIFAVGVGNGVDRDELKKIASEPYTSHVFLIRQFLDLTTLTEIIAEKRTDYNRCGVAGDIELQAQPGRVVGGDVANRGAWPWIAAVYQVHKAKGSIFTCGGALICENWVLTAAHCLFKKNGQRISKNKLFVQLGEYERGKDEGCEQTIPIAEYKLPEDYNSDSLDYDVALLRLAQPAKLVSCVRTLCLPKELDHFTVRPNSDDCYVAGWGITKANRGSNTDQPSLLLRQLKMPLVARHTCQQSTDISITDRMLCAGYRFKARDACKGDSGGPLVCRRRDDTFAAIGIVTKGDGCAEADKYGILTDVYRFKDWINEMTENCNQQYNVDLFGNANDEDNA